MTSATAYPNQDVLLSFIIPTLNEEKNIGRLIDSIKKYGNDNPFEIIVVDNGSTDNTCDIAYRKGAAVLSDPTASISTLRNHGAEASHGSIYVFLDGDVELTQEWSEEISNTIDLLKNNNKIITGSSYSIPNDSSFLEKYWFHNNHSAKYINGGHLIIHKPFFDELNGFDGELLTGEDTDISYRAKEQYGAKIINNKKLRVLHHGYPKNIYTFMKRESWHGTRSNKLIDVTCCSMVHLATDFFVFLHALLLLSFLFQSFFMFIGSVISLIALLLFSSAYKYASNIKLILINGVIFYFFLLGRSTSIFRALVKKSSIRSHR